eukprot:3458654-Pleurochrysis_carterae.AAC.1
MSLQVLIVAANLSKRLACTVIEFAGLEEWLVQLMLLYGAFIGTTCTTVYCGASEALSEPLTLLFEHMLLP